MSKIKIRCFNKKGQVGQVLITFAVFLFVLAVLVLFLIWIRFSGSYEEFNTGALEGIEDNRILAEVFLNDFIVIKGEKMKVNETLMEIADLTERDGTILNETAIKLRGLVEKKFEINYGCNDENILVVDIGMAGAGISREQTPNIVVGKRKVIIDYPYRMYDEVAVVSDFEGSTGDDVVSSRQGLFESAYTGQFFTVKGREFGVTVKENKKCWK